MSRARERPLTPRETRLVEAIADAASRGAVLTRIEAGTAAGYGSGEAARIQAVRALKRPAVRAALMQALAEAAQIGAAQSLAVIRHLETRGRSERVRLDAALAGVRMGGLDTTGALLGAVSAGPAVTINLHLDPEIGTQLTQRAAQPERIVDVRALPVRDDPLDEGVIASAPVLAAPGAARDPVRVAGGKGGPGGGGEAFAAGAPVEGGAVHNSPPESAAVGGAERGGSGVTGVRRKISPAGKRAKKRVKRVIRVSDEARAASSARMRAYNAARRAAAAGPADDGDAG